MGPQDPHRRLARDDAPLLRAPADRARRLSGQRALARAAGPQGLLFPDATSTVTTFAAFLEETWLSAAEPWAARIVRYEFDLLWGTPAKPTSAALDRGLRLPDGAWAADCRYDVPDYAVRLRETCADCPWPVAVQHTRPRGRPFATLTLRAGKGLRRIHLRDATCEALCPLWDEEADWPGGHEAVLAQAERRELVVPCAP